MEETESFIKEWSDDDYNDDVDAEEEEEVCHEGGMWLGVLCVKGFYRRDCSEGIVTSYNKTKNYLSS